MCSIQNTIWWEDNISISIIRIQNIIYIIVYGSVRVSKYHALRGIEASNNFEYQSRYQASRKSTLYIRADETKVVLAASRWIWIGVGLPLLLILYFCIRQCGKQKQLGLKFFAFSFLDYCGAVVSSCFFFLLCAKKCHGCTENPYKLDSYYSWFCLLFQVAAEASHPSVLLRGLCVAARIRWRHLCVGGLHAAAVVRQQ